MAFTSLAWVIQSSDINVMEKSSPFAKPKLTYTSCSCIRRSVCNVLMYSFIFERVTSLEIWLFPIINHPTSISSFNNKLADKLYIHNNIQLVYWTYNISYKIKNISYKKKIIILTFNCALLVEFRNEVYRISAKS